MLSHLIEFAVPSFNVVGGPGSLCSKVVPNGSVSVYPLLGNIVYERLSQLSSMASIGTSGRMAARLTRVFTSSLSRYRICSPKACFFLYGLCKVEKSAFGMYRGKNILECVMGSCLEVQYGCGRSKLKSKVGHVVFE